ncbi:MAG: urease accessory protein UreE [Burkholderiaceae bacterium]
MIIDRIVGKFADLQSRITAVDPVELPADKRQSPHWRARSRDGRSLAVSLPRGDELFEGDVLLIDGGTAVVVAAAPEDLLEVMPGSPRQWGIAAYQLGNLHRELRFLADSMLTPYDAIAEAVLRQAGIACRRATRAFTGERFGAHGAAHADGHGHGHRHEHGHDHHHR